MKLQLLKPQKMLNKAYLKEKVGRNDIEAFKAHLTTLLSKIKTGETEEHHKTPLADFLKDTWYKDLYEINTKGRTDLVIHNGKTTKETAGVIIEVKSPTNKTEMVSEAKPNVKAMHELILYYLRERLIENNTDIKRLVITNINEWFIFDEADFDKLFYRSSKLKSDFDNHRLGNKDTRFFFESIAKPFIDNLDEVLPCTYFDIRDYEKVVRNTDKNDDNKLIALYKILSPAHLLIQPFANDSNSLDKKFYAELLHIIGLEEKPDGGKKLIGRKAKPDAASLLESTIRKLEDKDCLHKVTGLSNFGLTTPDRLYNVALELCITWINRVLFIKLLEGQMVTYHKGDKGFKFLDIKTVGDFDELNDLFFLVLAERTTARHAHLKEKFSRIPYLNSSLFDRTPLERETIEISELSNRIELPVLAATVLKDDKGKKNGGSLATLQYLFAFLDAYDFSSDGGEQIQEENKNLINASVLGLIFEKINGYKDGSFFTPGFITQYMCRETIRRAVLQKFKEVKGWECENISPQLYDKIADKKEANTIVNSLKICDPAVGSGHFLVSALNEVIAIKSELGILQDRQHKTLRDYNIDVVNDELVVTDEDGKLLDYNPKSKESQRVQEALFHEKETIIENCLFGVDINPNSVKICRLRLWIELLKNTYYTTESNFTELETLPNIDINIKCGNSLISRFALHADLSKALKKSKLTIEAYKNAVQNYRSAESKVEKREMEELIESIKTNFRTEISDNDPKIKRLQKLNAEYYHKYQAGKLFDLKLTKAQKKDKEKFEDDIAKLDTEIKEIKSNKIYENAFEWRFEFPEVLDDDGRFIGFDMVIGNPPYISIQDLRASNPNAVDFYKEKYNSARNNSFDIYIPFIELSTMVINPNGFITLILPNKFFSTDYGLPIRNFLIENNWVDTILDFEHFQVFSDATTYTCILSLNKNTTGNFHYSKIEPQSIDKNSIKYDSINYKNVLNRTWSFENDIQQKISEKLNQDSVKLIELPALISRGSSTGSDTIFVLEIKDGKLYDDNNEEVQIESELLVTPIYSTDFGRYEFKNPKKYKLIFPYEQKNYSLIEENVLKECYPKAYKYLLKKKTILDARKQFGRWYGFSAARNLKVHAHANILIPLLANRGSFSLTPDNINQHTLLAGGGFSITIKNEKYKPNYILGLLNSKLLFYLLYRMSNKFRGGFVTCTKQYFEQLPIKNADIHCQKKIATLVDSIFSKKNEDIKADTSPLEQEIDQLVYQLYGLTEEEIKMVEGS